MLEQRRIRWADVIQMLYKCFAFAGNATEDPHKVQYLITRYDWAA